MVVRVSIIIICFCLLVGCAARPNVVRCPAITLPEAPDPVIVETVGIDKKKFPRAKWVKPPKEDLRAQTATWSFADIDKISGSLGQWAGWEKDVRELIEGHNKLTDRKEDKTKR